MLKKILLVLVVLTAAFVGFVAVQPSHFRVERSALIAAPPDRVFDHVNDFHRWEAWSPWAKLDPNSTVKFEGPESGQGAVFHWAGNSEVGKGTMEIVSSEPARSIDIRIEFTEPFAATNQVRFSFEPQGEQTEVTWAMEGENNFMGKVVCLFMNMDQMVGGDFEKGLASMKQEVERSEKPTDAEPS